MRDDLPTGTVTFLFTDVEGSTRLLHSLGAEAYAEALVMMAPSDQQVEQAPTKKPTTMTRPEDLARMENELKALEKDFAMLDDAYGRNVVDLTLARGYLKKLLDNGKVVRFLAQKYPEILAEFQRVVEAMSLEA